MLLVSLRLPALLQGLIIQESGAILSKINKTSDPGTWDEFEKCKPLFQWSREKQTKIYGWLDPTSACGETKV